MKIRGVKHEFSTIPGVKEDVVEIILNLKKIRFRFYADEPQVLSLKVKGEKKITAAEIEANSLVEVINSDQPIFTITSKNTEVEMDLTVEKGLGYVPVEARKTEKFPIGTIAIDAFFTPLRIVNFKVENMRVGERTDYNRLRLTIKTDGSITPSSAIHKAANVLRDHIDKISAIEVKETEAPVKLKPAKKTRKTKKLK